MSAISAANAQEQEPCPTRESALARLAACEDAQSVFQIANSALSVWRQSWGDDERVGAAAAWMWASCAFPVGAVGRARFEAGQIEGERLERLGIGAAKRIAQALLAPTPASSPGGRLGRLSARRLRSLWGAGSGGLSEAAREDEPSLAPLWGALAQAKAAQEELGRELAARGPKAPGGRQAQWSALCGRGPWLALESLTGGMDPLAAAQAAGFSGWAAAREALAPSASEPAPGELARRARQWAGEAGLDWVGVGPVGGAGGALEELESARERLKRVARALDLPTELMGLGGLALSVNASMGPQGVCVPADFCAHIRPRQPTGEAVAHEWAHALERVCEVSSGPEARWAMQGLRSARQAIQTAPADAKVAQAALAGAGWRRRHAACLASLAGGDGPPADPARAQAAWRAAERALLGRGERSAKAMESARAKAQSELGDGARLGVEGFAALAREAAAWLRRERRLEELLAQGLSVFAAASKVAEQERLHGRGSGGPRRNAYWALGEEKLARAAEGLALDPEDPKEEVFCLWDAVWPRGQERQRLERAVREWAQSARPLLARLASQRRLSAPSPRASRAPG